MIDKIAEWLEGKKTHIANLGSFAFTIYLWRKGAIPATDALALGFANALIAIARLFAKTPGPLA